MITPRTPDPDLSVEGDFLPNLASFGRHLRAENRSPSTVTTYAKAVGQLTTYRRDVLGRRRGLG